MPIYYYIGHFSKYIQKGAVRVASTKHEHRIHTVAFRNPDGTIVLVVMNPTDEEQPAIIRHNNTCTQAGLKPYSILMVIW